MKRLSAFAAIALLATVTLAQPSAERQLFDFVVPDDGDFKTAIAAANNRNDQQQRFRIFIRQGKYIIPASTASTVMGMDSVAYPDPRTELTASNVSIIGEGLDATIIINECPDITVPGQWGPACPIEGLRKAYTLHNCGTDNYFQDIRFVNGMKDGTGRGEAFEESGDRTICKRVGMWGYQDTYCSNNSSGRYYFEGGVIRGRTDYICGKGDIFFNAVEFRHCQHGGYIAVPSQPRQYGYVMSRCSITGEQPGIDGTYTLGRPWSDGYSLASWINTVCHITPSPAGWGSMSNRWPKRMAEYGTVNTQGDTLDLSHRRTMWIGSDSVTHTNTPVLTRDEAATLTVSTVLSGDDNWSPQTLAADAPPPANVAVKHGSTLTWDDSGEALCWAVCRNNAVWRFTTEPRVNIPNDGCDYTVRAANYYGGLGEAVKPVYSKKSKGLVQKN